MTRARACAAMAIETGATSSNANPNVLETVISSPASRPRATGMGHISPTTNTAQNSATTTPLRPVR